MTVKKAGLAETDVSVSNDVKAKFISTEAR
jgi:hypothetical protein